MPPEEVIKMMVRQFKKVFGPELEGTTSQLAISQREAIILASIIEKETPLSEEAARLSRIPQSAQKEDPSSK